MLTTDALLLLLLVMLVGWFWLETLRAREMAVTLARRACDAQQVQLLDQAVALRRLGLRWGRQGLQIRREYRFDVSNEGVERHTGTLVLHNLQLAAIDLGHPGQAVDRD